MTNLDFKELANELYYSSFYNEDRYLVLWGGAGSGKSHFAAQKIIFRILMDYNKVQHKFLVIRKTTPSVRDSCYALLRDYLVEWRIPHETKDLYIKVLGSEILFKGIDDPEKIKSIEGITGIWLEEPTGLHYKDFEQLDLRLRGSGPYKQLMLTFNPVGGRLSWLFKLFFVTDHPHTTLVHSTWKDNRFLDKEYIDKLEDLKDETYRKIYGQGLWAELKAAVYNRYTIKELDVPQILNSTTKIYAGVDFGFNDPSVFLLIAEYDQVVYVLDEIYQSKLTNIEFIAKIKALLDHHKSETIDLRKITLYCDSAEPARITEMNKAHNNLKAIAAQKNVKDGIDELKRHDIVIDPRCVHTAEELPMYSWEVDKDDNVRDTPVKFKDHTPDALRYGVYSEKKKGIIINV